MKKRIVSILILVLSLVSIFALSSCGKEEEKIIKCPSCQEELEKQEEALLCENLHLYKECINEECASALNLPDNFCTSCGTSQAECPECADGEIDGVYCPKCGKQVLQTGEMKFKFDVNALGESAMILCKGMLGIFIVTGVIISFILILNTVVEKINQSKKNKE